MTFSFPFIAFGFRARLQDSLQHRRFPFPLSLWFLFVRKGFLKVSLIARGVAVNSRSPSFSILPALSCRRFGNVTTSCFWLTRFSRAFAVSAMGLLLFFSQEVRPRLLGSRSRTVPFCRFSHSRRTHFGLYGGFAFPANVAVTDLLVFFFVFVRVILGPSVRHDDQSPSRRCRKTFYGVHDSLRPLLILRKGFFFFFLGVWVHEFVAGLIRRGCIFRS